MARFKSYDAAVSAGYGARDCYCAPLDDRDDLEERAFEAWLKAERPRLLKTFREETEELRTAVSRRKMRDVVGKVAGAANRTLGIEFGLVQAAVPYAPSKSPEMKSLDALREAASKVY